MAARYRWDDFILDLDSFRLERAGAPLPLEPKAINLLALLVARPGHLFTKQEIFHAVWPGTAVSDHALTRVVAQLRRALGEDAKEARYLETVPTRGYRWNCPVEVVVVEAPSPSPLPIAELPEGTASPTPRGAGRQRPWLVGAGAAVLIVVVAAVVLEWARQPSSVVDTRASGEWLGSLRGQFPVQLTTHPGLDLHPAFSPQGDAIAFASDRSGAFEIYVRSLGQGAADVAVTTDGGQNVQPAWSPDGTEIAYHSATHGGIWVIAARGGVARQIVPRGSSPRWAPDGRRIVYQSDEFADVTPTGSAAHVGATLMLADVASGESRALTRLGQPSGAHAIPAWSRDGRYVAFSVFGGGDDNGLWVVRVATGEVTPIERAARVYEAAFAENDTALYIVAGEPVIFRRSFDPARGVATGDRAEILVPGVPGARGLSVSPDGRHLAFGGLGLTSHVWAQPVDAAGRPIGEPSALTRDTSRRNYMPSMSPDGASLAYMSARRGEQPNLWLMDLATRQPRQLTDDEAADRDPAWLPDGRRLTYRRESPSEPAVRVIDVVTRRNELLVSLDRPPSAEAGSDAPIGALGELDVSPSGRRVAFSMVTPPNAFRRLFVMDVEKGLARAVSPPAASVGYPVWSPDERLLAVEIEDDGDTHLGIVDVGSGQMRQVTRGKGQVWIHSWSPTGERVVAAVRRDRLWSLEWLDVQTAERGAVVPPASPSVYYRYPAWSPRGDLIAYERGQMHGNIWRLALPPAP